MVANIELISQAQGAELSKDQPLVTFPDGERVIYPFMPFSSRGFQVGEKECRRLRSLEPALMIAISLLPFFKEQLDQFAVAAFLFYAVYRVAGWLVLRNAASPTTSLTRNEWRYLFLRSRGPKCFWALAALMCVLFPITLAWASTTINPWVFVVNFLAAVYAARWIWETWATMIVFQGWEVW